MEPKHNIPLLSYLKRNIALLLCFAVAFALSKWESLFQSAGPMIYLPVMFIGAMIAATVARHFFWRNSIDAFAQTGGFLAAWNDLPPAERARWTMAVTLTLILCASLIAAAIAK